MAGLNEYQRFIADHYEAGELSFIECEKDAHKMGDGLFAFLVAEVGDSEGCDSYDEIIRRLEKAREQIEQLVLAARLVKFRAAAEAKG